MFLFPPLTVHGCPLFLINKSHSFSPVSIAPKSFSLCLFFLIVPTLSSEISQLTPIVAAAIADLEEGGKGPRDLR